jgi:hypothetical protein
MKTMFNQKTYLAGLVSLVLFLITSCAPQVKLTSSWTNRQAKIKSSPVIMVMVLGKPGGEVRQNAENSIVAKLKREGFKAIPASTLIKPGVQKPDSAQLVGILRENKIDMLLASAVIKVTEKERFIPGAIQGSSEQPTGAAYSSPNNPYYNNYFGYYSYYAPTQTIEAPQALGTTVTDVEVLVESRLYQVATPELIWYGKSTVYTKEISKSLIKYFSKLAVDDIMKNKLLIK